jgi:hypothetical protein
MMADNRKEQERAELHRTIWNIANDLEAAWTAGISSSMFLVCYFTATYQKI